MFCLKEFSSLQVSVVLLFNTEPKIVSVIHWNLLSAIVKFLLICQAVFPSLELLSEIIISWVSHLQRCKPQIFLPFLCQRLHRHEMFNKTTMDTQVSPLHLFSVFCSILFFQEQVLKYRQSAGFKNVARIISQFTIISYIRNSSITSMDVSKLGSLI